MVKKISIIALVSVFFILSATGAEAAGRGLTCAQVKKQAVQPLHTFEYGVTEQEPKYGYALFLRDREYMQKQLMKKKTLKQYIASNTEVTFLRLGERKIKLKSQPNKIVVTEFQITTEYKKSGVTKKAVRKCYVAPTITCPIITINETLNKDKNIYIGPADISCISSDRRGFLSQSIKDLKKDKRGRVGNLGSRCTSGPACSGASQGKGGRAINPNNRAGMRDGKGKGSFNPNPNTERNKNKGFSPVSSGGYRAPITRKKSQQQKGQSSPISGFIKQLQGAFKQNGQQKSQADARAQASAAQQEARARAEYQARLRLPQCHPAHPYYSYNKEKCTNSNVQNPTIESYGEELQREQSQRRGNIDTVVVRRGGGVVEKSSLNPVTVESLRKQRCENKKAQSIIVAKPRSVKSGEGITIKWGSVCTSSCSVMGYEVETGTESLPQPELGLIGDITGKLYNDTRFELSCKDFRGRSLEHSEVTVKIK